jgi:hypothetical protein
MENRRYITIALISMTLLGLELVWTRIFSAEYFYAFAFLTLSLAILGLGLGALSLRLWGMLNRKETLGIALTLTGLMALIGPPLVIKLGLDFGLIASNWAMFWRFILTLLLLGSSFFFGGIAVALLFKRHYDDMPRLYMADLLGAGVGVILAILLMNGVGTPGAATLSALPVLLAAAFLECRKWRKVFPAAVIILVFALLPRAETMLEPERQERAPVIYKHWDAMAKIKMYDFGGYYRGINVDNVSNSPVIPFDGTWDDEDSVGADWDINVKYLVNQFDSCTFLSLGSGGGGDVLQALDHKCAEIHAVEVNAHINYMMVHGDSAGYVDYVPPEPEEPEETIETAESENAGPEGAGEGSGETEAPAEQEAGAEQGAGEAAESAESAEVAQADTTGEGGAREEPPPPPQPPPMPPPVIRDSTGKIITLPQFSGYIFHDPRVKVVTEDARTYVKRHKGEFDVIFSLSSNTWAALGSGSFALAENYLFTTEAFADYWAALSDSGFMSMEHQAYMPRIVSMVKDGLRSQGVEDPTRHFAVYDLPQMRRKLLLLSKRPLTDEIRYNAYGPLTKERESFIYLLYPAPDSLADNPINVVVTQGWEVAQDSARTNIRPCTDDRPFAAQMGHWKNFSWENLRKMNMYAEFMGFPLAGTLILVILVVVLVFFIPLNLIPFLREGPKLGAVPWLYFFAIGMGFMMIEVVLIQKYTLFIGASVYSIAAVLLTLLIASGVGSRYSRAVAPAVAFLAILAWLALDILVLGHVTRALAGLTMLPRTLVTAGLIFPLGFFMGMPFPKGTLRVGELVDWGFAVNGAASVLGATLVLLVAFSYGFSASLMVGGLMYLLALILMSIRSAW